MRDMDADRLNVPTNRNDGCESETEALTGILAGKVPEDMNRCQLRDERLREKYAVPATDTVESAEPQRTAKPYTPEEMKLWEELTARQGTVFRTSKGMEFTYTIRGGEMFIARKEKSVTMATVFLSYRRAKEVQAAEGCVSGPKKIGTFGASYLYPVFLQLGIITREPEDRNGDREVRPVICDQ